MKAVLYRRYGGLEVLEYTDVREPSIRDHQLLVKVHAAGVNPVDWKLRKGNYPFPFLPWPRIPGSDIAGEVVRVGRSVKRFRAGDGIYAMLFPLFGGGCAEYAAVPESNAARKPRNLSYEEAAAVPLAGLTALQALRDHGRIARDDTVLVNGASGGVGYYAVQIARAYGAEVTGVSGPKNLEFIRALGAGVVIDYASEDFTASRSRYDIVFDAVGLRSFRGCRASLRPHGTYITTLPDLSTIARMAAGPLGGGKRARFVTVRARGRDLEQLTAWIEAGQLRIHIDRTFPLSKTAEAQAFSETGHVRGKCVIGLIDSGDG
jgi:NADPH:quinone reductase-like Zn-dependent oxidoreductase